MTTSVPLRLVEWNVAMALQRKVDLLATLRPGVAVLPETADPSHTESSLRRIGATSVQWVGANPHKGLSVVGFDGWQVRMDESYDPGYQWVLPVHVTGPAYIRLLAVWDMDLRGSGHESAKQLGSCRASLPHYDEFLSGDADLVLLSGDFNNSVCWDTPNKRSRFGDFMDQLEDRGFVSAYHRHYRAGRGAENHPTLWWMKNLRTTFHIDYTFVSDAETISEVSVGEHDDWLTHSDHSPMTVDLRVHPRTDAPAAVDGARAIDGAAEPSATSIGAGPATDTPVTDTPVTAASVIVATATDTPVTDTPVAVGPVTVAPSASAAATEPVSTPVRARSGAAADSDLSFPLTPGAVADLRCGNNGEARVRLLRPTHFTARRTNEVIVEVKVLGPQVRKDGALGSRLLDHCWRRSAAAGGIDLDDLPPAVAATLRAHLADV